VAVSGALRKGIMRERAHYFHFSAENAKIADWMAERGGFEPPRPFKIRWAGFGRVWRTIRPRKKHPCWREFVRLGFGSSSYLLSPSLSS
jgi:hypothetical protein